MVLLSLEYCVEKNAVWWNQVWTINHARTPPSLLFNYPSGDSVVRVGDMVPGASGESVGRGLSLDSVHSQSMLQSSVEWRASDSRYTVW